jgi:TRAP transporter TAXI family solute receptor
VPVVGVSNLLVVDARMSEKLAYQITRALFQRKADLVAIHQEARNLNLESATVGSPVPFHPGAIEYYREQKAWPH